MEITYVVIVSVVTYVLGAITKLFIESIPNRNIPIQNVIIGIVSVFICYFTKIEPLDFNFKEEVKYGNMICDIISKVRGEKSINNLSLKTEVKELKLSCEEKLIEAINSSIKDFF